MSPGQCFYTDQSTRMAQMLLDAPLINIDKCFGQWSFNIYDGRKKTAPTKIKTPANELEFYQGK